MAHICGTGMTLEEQMQGAATVKDFERLRDVQRQLRRPIAGPMEQSDQGSGSKASKIASIG